MAYFLTHVALEVKNPRKTAKFFESWCGWKIVHQRARDEGDGDVIWIGEPGLDKDFIVVLLPNPEPQTTFKGLSHFGLAVESKDEVDKIAQRAVDEGILVWEPKQEPYPVGYYCAISDPDGNIIELSYGQPLGPGSKT